MGLRNFAAATLSTLAIGGGMEACEGNPKPEAGVHLTDPELDHELECTRALFERVAIYDGTKNNGWAGDNCPDFAEKVNSTMQADAPLATVIKTRDDILTRAGVDTGIENWELPFSKYGDAPVLITTTESAVDIARAEGKVK